MTRRATVRIALTLLLLIGIVRLVQQSAWFAGHVLQQDFSAFCTAGQSVRAGQSPYINLRDRQPPIWDGCAIYRHSRFLYPPIVADLFGPITLLEYARAKALWTVGILCCAAASVLLVWRILRPLPLEVTLIGAVAAAWFGPMTAELAVGQIDALTGLLITAAMVAAVSGRRSGDVAAGILLALATVLKLHIGLLVPFLLMQRSYRLLVVYAIGLVTIAAVSVLIDGRATLMDYLAREMPRISRYGQGAPPSESPLYLDVDPRGAVMKDNREYLRSDERVLTGFCTLSTRLANQGSHLGLTNSTASLLLCGGAWLLVTLALDAFRRPIPSQGPIAITFWFLAGAIIMLTGPMTWRMNLVWLMPLWLVLVAWYVRGQRGTCFWMAVIGLFIITLPIDRITSPGGIGWLLERRDLAGEIMVVVGLTCLLRSCLKPDESNMMGDL